MSILRGLSVAISLPIFFVGCLLQNKDPQYLSAWLGLLNLIVFSLYGWDKKQSMLHGRRIRERTLHGLSLMGGWPGAFVGQVLFRHKRAKPVFTLVHWASFALSVLLAYLRLRYGH